MSLIKPRRTVDKTEYLKHCSKAELAAMFLNSEIDADEYFAAFKLPKPPPTLFES